MLCRLQGSNLFFHSEVWVAQIHIKKADVQVGPEYRGSPMFYCGVEKPSSSPFEKEKRFDSTHGSCKQTRCLNRIDSLNIEERVFVVCVIEVIDTYDGLHPFSACQKLRGEPLKTPLYDGQLVGHRHCPGSMASSHQNGRWQQGSGCSVPG